MKHLFTLAFILLIGSAHAQNTPVANDSPATVNVFKDPRFDELADKQAEINKRAQKLLPRWVQGWRIQAANTQDRNEANAVKAEMLRRFPDYKTYMVYQSPNFRVRVGDFMAQKDAFKLRKQIAALYPGKGIYIVADTIEVPPTGEEEEEQLPVRNGAMR